MSKKIIRVVLKVLSIVLIITLALVSLINITLIAKSIINDSELPTFFGFSYLAVETDSMAPVFSGGDLIIVKECNPEDLSINDIATYYDPSVSDNSVLITHRIVGITEDDEKKFQFKGDANNVSDSDLIKSENIAGKYLLHIPGLGKIVMWLSTVPGMIISIAIPLILLYSVNLFSNKKTKQSQ